MTGKITIAKRNEMNESFFVNTKQYKTHAHTHKQKTFKINEQNER